MNATKTQTTPSINPRDGRSVPAQAPSKPEDELTRITGNIANWAIQSANAIRNPTDVSNPC